MRVRNIYHIWLARVRYQVITLIEFHTEWLHSIYYITYFLADIDECSTLVHTCDHNCTNNKGSYVCSCMNGYTLDTDGNSCLGKLTYYWYFQSPLL